MAKCVSPEQVENLLSISKVEEAVLFGRVVVQEYELPCGYTVGGRAACNDIEAFDLEIGRKIARKKAGEQLWCLLAYEAQVQEALSQMS